MQGMFPESFTSTPAQRPRTIKKLSFIPTKAHIQLYTFQTQNQEKFENFRFCFNVLRPGITALKPIKRPFGLHICCYLKRFAVVSSYKKVPLNFYRCFRVGLFFWKSPMKLLDTRD